MENKKVLLHIRGMQFDISHSDEEDGAIETVTTGILRKIGARPAPNEERDMDRDSVSGSETKQNIGGNVSDPDTKRYIGGNVSDPDTKRYIDQNASGPDGCYVIKYEEIQEDFGQASRVLLKVSPGRLEMTKRGLLNVRMEFEEGKYTQSEYGTPFGDLLFGIHTRQVRVDERPEGVCIHAAYMMEMNGEYLADSAIEILAEYID
ncbi:MAG: DUF1934 domain-containing protein [Lachnospiraceae bacterium]|nr:DUF1934 domain-containing protein [Lachnospiraceae bacterium]